MDLSDFLNTAVLKQPMNWLVIFSMLLIWGFAFDLVLAYHTDRDPSQAA